MRIMTLALLGALSGAAYGAETKPVTSGTAAKSATGSAVKRPASAVQAGTGAGAGAGAGAAEAADVKVKYKKEKRVDFSNQTVEGKLHRPEASLVTASEA